MNRPASIVRFEQLYLAAFAIGVLNTVLFWTAMRERLAASIAVFGPVFLPIASAIGFAITLLLWYFIARRGSVVAKWIATVFAAFAAIGLIVAVIRLSFGTGHFSATIGLGFLSSLFEIVAVSMLFKPDAKDWFGEPSPAIDQDEIN